MRANLILNLRAVVLTISLCVIGGCTRTEVRGPQPITLEGMRAHYVANGFPNQIAIHDEFLAVTNFDSPTSSLRRNSICWIRSASFNQLTRWIDTRTWRTVRIYNESNSRYPRGVFDTFSDDFQSVIKFAEAPGKHVPFIEGLDSITIYVDNNDPFMQNSLASFLDNYHLPYVKKVATDEVRTICRTA